MGKLKRPCSWCKAAEAREAGRFCSDDCYQKEWRHNYERNHGVKYTTEQMRDRRKPQDEENGEEE